MRRPTYILSAVKLRIVAATAAIFCGASVRAEVNLEWRSATPIVLVGDTVKLGLYAVSDDPQSDQALSAIDMVLSWDPSLLRLVGVDNTGAVAFAFSGFPFVEPFNLNEEIPPQDGDGLYQAQVGLGGLVVATGEGTLITTLEFATLATTAGSDVLMSVPKGTPSTDTVVWDGVVANHPITGTLDDATVTIVIFGDYDANDRVDLIDLPEVLNCLSGPEAATQEGCDVADVDLDADVDFRDWAAWVNAFTG